MDGGGLKKLPDNLHGGSRLGARTSLDGVQNGTGVATGSSGMSLLGLLWVTMSLANKSRTSTIPVIQCSEIYYVCTPVFNMLQHIYSLNDHSCPKLT